jgi:hypothetical protein
VTGADEVAELAKVAESDGSMSREERMARLLEEAPEIAAEQWEETVAALDALRPLRVAKARKPKRPPAAALSRAPADLRGSGGWVGRETAGRGG